MALVAGRRPTSASGPTFVTGRGVLVEAYLLDYDGDLYDRELRLAFLARLRGERRFDDVDALVEQMHRDVERHDPRADRGLSADVHTVCC